MQTKKYDLDIATRELLDIFRKRPEAKKTLTEDFQVPTNPNTGDIESFKSGISPNIKIETFNQNEGNTFVKGYVPFGSAKAMFVYDTTKTSPMLTVEGSIDMTDENTEILSKIGGYFDIWLTNLNKN